jgi:hypothetical protein
VRVHRAGNVFQASFHLERLAKRGAQFGHACADCCQPTIK